MSKPNIEKEIRRAKELAARFVALKSTVTTDDAAVAQLREEHGDEGNSETVPAHIARLFEDSQAPTPIHPFAPSARPRGPFVRG